MADRDRSVGRSEAGREVEPGARTSRRGRVCSEPGCTTRLSIYNDADRCALHQPMESLRTRGRKIA
jgi:hypothetical protein